ncbi:hypothetical protein C6A85_11990, partial [Mycobacterium sp. ITM-2017-0098]
DPQVPHPPGRFHRGHRRADPHAEGQAQGRGREVRRRHRGAVQRLDVGGELLGHDLALDLQRGGQLAGVLGEIDREDAELAD